jgi:hypothetical protein
MTDTYFLPADLATGCVKLKSLHALARRYGFWLVHTPHGGWSLIDQATGRALEGLSNVSFAEAAREVVNLKAKAKKTSKKSSIAKATKKSLDPFDQLNLFAAKIKEASERAEMTGTQPVDTINGDDPLMPRHTPFSVGDIDIEALARRIFKD